MNGFILLLHVIYNGNAGPKLRFTSQEEDITRAKTPYQHKMRTKVFYNNLKN